MTQVWMSRLARRNLYHQPAGARTECGIYFGFGEGKPSAGQLLTEDEAVAAGGAPCRTCSGERRRVKPSVVRKGQTR